MDGDTVGVWTFQSGDLFMAQSAELVVFFAGMAPMHRSYGSMGSDEDVT